MFLFKKKNNNNRWEETFGPPYRKGKTRLTVPCNFIFQRMCEILRLRDLHSIHLQINSSKEV